MNFSFETIYISNEIHLKMVIHIRIIGWNNNNPFETAPRDGKKNDWENRNNILWWTSASCFVAKHVLFLLSFSIFITAQ